MVACSGSGSCPGRSLALRGRNLCTVHCSVSTTGHPFSLSLPVFPVDRWLAGWLDRYASTSRYFLFGPISIFLRCLLSHFLAFALTFIPHHNDLPVSTPFLPSIHLLTCFSLHPVQLERCQPHLLSTRCGECRI